MSGTVTQSQRPAAPPPTAPAVPPEVTYRDGLLTVQAANSSLGSVVTAIRNKTGIEFEGGENASERVALSVGPAPEGDVLSQIFAGSRYDYVAIGRPDSPGVVQRVILTMKSKGGEAGSPTPQATPAGQNADEEDTPDEQPNEPQDTPVQPPPEAQQQPQQPPQGQQQQPKTPEQLLQELQQMQQQKSGSSDPNAAQAPRKQPQ